MSLYTPEPLELQILLHTRTKPKDSKQNPLNWLAVIPTHTGNEIPTRVMTWSRVRANVAVTPLIASTLILHTSSAWYIQYSRPYPKRDLSVKNACLVPSWSSNLDPDKQLKSRSTTPSHICSFRTCSKGVVALLVNKLKTYIDI